MAGSTATSAHPAFDVCGHPALLTGGLDFEAVGLRPLWPLYRAPALMREALPQLGLAGWNDDLKLMAIIGFRAGHAYVTGG